jgi:hypothetical protein
MDNSAQIDSKALLGEIIALRGVVSILLKMLLEDAPDEIRKTAFDLCSSITKTANLRGFDPQSELQIRTTAEAAVEAIFMAKIRRIEDRD